MKKFILGILGFTAILTAAFLVMLLFG